MNYSIVRLLNELKKNFKLKKLKLIVKNTKQNLLFFQYLQEKNVIHCIVNQKENLVIFLKYDVNFNPSISSFSTISKKSHQRPSINSKALKNKNFIVNLTTTKTFKTKLLARLF